MSDVAVNTFFCTCAWVYGSLSIHGTASLQICKCWWKIIIMFQAFFRLPAVTVLPLTNTCVYTENERNFALTFLDSSVRFHYNKCIQSKSLFSLKSLTLPCTYTVWCSCLFSKLQSLKSILWHLEFLFMLIFFVQYFRKRLLCTSKTFLHLSRRHNLLTLSNIFPITDTLGRQ